MNLKNLFLGLSLGILTANSLPQSGENNLQLRGTQTLPETNPELPVFQARAPPGPQSTAAITLTIQDECDPREGLYVPMLYAAWMPTTGSKFERWNCNIWQSNAKCTRQKATDFKTQVVPRKIVTDQLALCISINVMTSAGTIMTHLNPDVYNIINGVTVSDPSGVLRQQAAQLKKSCAKLMSKHRKDMGGKAKMSVAVVAGPQANGESRASAANVVNQLFGLGLDFYWKLDQRGGPAQQPNVVGERTTTVDMAGPSTIFWVENSPYTIPPK